MNKSDWFVSYCNMSEDEKWYYREFEMEDELKTYLNIYVRMYEAVELMSFDYDKQISLLPKKINIPDEIALVFDDEVIAVKDVLYEIGMISSKVCILIENVGDILTKIGKQHNKELWTLDALKQSELWEECRQNAKILLASLFKLEYV